ncbi:MAG TPA: hypothetical protein VK253_01835 [Candidatus Binatia bacterium]|nr:hypothetical protein [Candidatus Binatia bacterium]
MNSKSIALVITFAAVAIALNAIRIPTVFYPGSFFQFSQIPIVVAFLLFGAKIGVLVGLLNLAGGLALFPIGVVGFIAYPMDFVSALLMFAGIWLASRFTLHGNKSGSPHVMKKSAVGFTLGAIAVRAGIMPFVDYAIVYHVMVPLILGVQPPEAYILGLVPAFVLYNAIVALYVVSVAYVVAAKASKPLKIWNKHLN